jgi:adenylate cyclase
MLYRFGDFTLDRDGAELRRAGEPVATEPQVIGLLSYLVENRDRVISKDELIEAVWNGRIVSDATLNSRINSVRRAVGDSGKAQSVNRTHSKQGYRFVANLQSDMTLEISADKPSIAVLPFANLPDDPADEYFADGITEDIITSLSAYHALRVIARNSSFAYRRQDKSVQEIGAALDVQYLVEGSVRKNGNRVRVTARLADVATGAEIWSQRYDRELEDIFAVQDEVTESVVAILPDRLQAADLARAKRKNTGNMAAYDYLLRGVDHYYKETREDNARAADYLEQAIALDPNYAQALAWLACTLGQGKYRGYFEEDIDERGHDLITRAQDLDGNDSEVYRILAAIHTNMGKHAEADRFLERAIVLNSNDPKVLCQKCDTLIWMGNALEALQWLEAAKRRDPNMDDPWWRLSGRANFELKNYQPAHEALGRVRFMRPMDRACLAASYAYFGRSAEAKSVAAEIIEIAPKFDVTKFVNSQPFFSQESRDHLAEGLRKAGLG